MRPGQSAFRGVLFTLLFFAMACNSKPSQNATQSLSSSGQQDKASSQSPQQPSQSGATKGKEEEPISYAKNPDRFSKVEPYEPPFNITNPKTAQEHFNVAVNFDHLNQLDNAIGEYKTVLEMQPDWAVAHYRLAVDYQKLSRGDDAIAEWQQATKYNPQFYSAYDMMAGEYERQGKIKKAIEAYSPLLNYPPARLPVHYQLGFWYSQIGDRAQARVHLESYRDLALKTRDEPKSDRFQKALDELKKLKQQG